MDLVAPFQYMDSLSGKKVRSRLAMAMNIWLNIGNDFLDDIIDVIETLHCASLM